MFLDSKSSGAIHAGSIPASGTTFTPQNTNFQTLYFQGLKKVSLNVKFQAIILETATVLWLVY